MKVELATDTRDQAYEQIVNTPKQSNSQQEVLNLLRQYNNLSNSEMSSILGWTINRITPRVYELRELGLVTLDEKRKCRVTGRIVQTWKATSR